MFLNFLIWKGRGNPPALPLPPRRSARGCGDGDLKDGARAAGSEQRGVVVFLSWCSDRDFPFVFEARH